ncbi:MAG: helix-turn-helix transcriptional regulator [Oscillibacter sp.]|nr:helix-turn-helix transcriptional regulator [Oscillibacter sp.]
MEIGKRIQQLRREKNLTQEQTAAALGVTSAAVSKWETGAAVPDVAMLCPLARLLGTTVDQLLDFRPALEQEEINVLLEQRQKLFEAGKAAEAAASCEALLREYPDDLRLKCAAAGLYIMYVPAICDAGGMDDPIGRAVSLLEESRESGDPVLAASSRSMLVNLYVMREEYDRALAVLDEEPEARQNIGTARANILLRKNELDGAEKLYQRELWSSGRNVVLNLIGMYNAARGREDWARAMECLDIALEAEKVLRTEELGGLTGSLHMLRAEALRKQGRPDEAMESLTEYVDRSLAQWARLNSAEALHSAFYNRLDVRGSGMSAAYLAKYIRAALEESEELAPLREREDFRSLLARLAEAGAQ